MADVPRGVPAEPFESRFWSRVRKTRGCWEWIGAQQIRRGQPKGYGKLTRDYQSLKAHRVSWELHFGEIPDGLFVLHECDNPPCVRPDHLFLGTSLDNTLDAMRKGRLNTDAMHAVPEHKRNRRRGKDHRWYGSTESRGEGNLSAKLTTEKVIEIRSLEGTMSQEKLAKRFGIGQAQLSRILRRKCWRHV